jgi:hypothetical protein
MNKKAAYLISKHLQQRAHFFSKKLTNQISRFQINKLLPVLEQQQCHLNERPRHKKG